MKTRVGSHYRRNFGLFLLLLIGYVGWCLLKPLPSLTPETATSVITAKSTPSSLAWPASQAAVSVVGTDIVETNGKQTPVPTASTAKLITSLMVLNKKPLKIGQQGPIITLNANDVAIYKDYVARDGSVVPVLAGEQISQYQALQTVMLPSANNIADSLAIWAYGSLPAYASAANAYLKQNGILNTNVGSDASGLAADSTSTAEDLAKIGVLAMQNPVLAQIAGQSTASGIPVVGNIKNVNDLIGMYGIIGLKTGNSNEAGGAFVSASQTKVNGKQVVITTAVVNAPSLFQSMKQSIPLIKSAQQNFTDVTLVKKGQVVGKYNLPWGGSVDAIAKADLAIGTWNGAKPKASISLDKISSSSQAETLAGKVTIKRTSLNDQKTIAAILKNKPVQPSTIWLLTHPFSR